MAQVYVCEIQTYEVSIGRSRIYRESESEFGKQWERSIRLNLIPGRFGDGVTIADLLFYEGFESATLVRRDDLIVKIYNPLDDYKDIYKLLRTERPLFFWWQPNHLNEDSMTTYSWRITTMREPIAEGDSEI